MQKYVSQINKSINPVIQFCGDDLKDQITNQSF